MSKKKQAEGDYITFDTFKKIMKKEKNEIYKLISMLMWYGGLRVSEALSVTRKSIDTKRNELKIWRKGSSFRAVPVPKEVLEKVLEYTKIHRFEKGGVIFPYSRQSVYVALNKHGFTEGGVKRIHPHALRRGFGVDYAEKSEGDYATLQQMYNHSKLEMTLRYINITSPHARKKMHSFWETQEVIV